MDNTTLTATVARVLSRVLEDASFVFTDDMPDTARTGALLEGSIGVSLTFTGERRGTFRLWGAPAFAALLAANMTGVDAESPLALEKGADAMKEILNIIVGNALTELYGTSAVFDLGIPQTAAAALLDADRRRPDAVWLMAEEYPLLCVAEVGDG